MSTKLKINTFTQGEKEIFDDEITVEICSALGCELGMILMPKKMEQPLIQAYLDSGAVRSIYLYINGKEITDNKNHNVFAGI